MAMRWLAIPAVVMVLTLGPAAAEPFRIALVEDSRDVESQRGEQGFRLGLDYATKGAFVAGGRAIELSIVESGGDPTAAARWLTEIYRESRADLAVSLVSSGTAAIQSVTIESRRILLVARGGGDLIAGRQSSRFVFRTDHNASQLALACVLAIGTPELNLLVVAPDTREGHAAVAALKDAVERLQRGVFFIGSKFIRTNEADIGAAVSSEFEDFHYLHGAKTLLVLWTDLRPPIAAIAAENPGRLGIRLAFCGDMDPSARSLELGSALEGVTSYFPTLPRNATNDWLLSALRDRDGERPDAATADGMTAAIAVVNALAVARSTEADALISALEGLSFETPKGRMTIRPEDHQTLQTMYQFRKQPTSDLPELAREIGISEIPLPVP
jgi:branched-chain amino acid transport system substrate-binding protein